MPDIRPDILVRNPQGFPVAVVEVKNRQNLSRDIATAFRRNLLNLGMNPHGPYFLLTSQDKGYLWTGAKEKNLDAEPTYEFPMDAVITRYVKRSPGERLYNIELEYLIQQWLTDLADGTQKTSEEPEKTLALAGFNDVIKGATIIAEEDQ